MPGVLRFSATFGVAIVGVAIVVATGCATRVDVTVDNRHDFSGDRTWAWLSQSTRVVGDPDGVSEQLHSLTAQIVERELRSRGLAPSREGADLVVTSKLDVMRLLVTTHETGAVGFLGSHHWSPSYEVQASTKHTRVVHDARLRIVFSTPKPEQRVVWTGEVRTRQPGGLPEQLRAAVAEVLSRFRPAFHRQSPASE